MGALTEPEMIALFYFVFSLIFFFFAVGGWLHMACGILVPQLGSNPCAVWKHDFLATGLPGKCLMALNKTNHFSFT